MFDFNTPPVALPSSFDLPLYSAPGTIIGSVVAYDTDANQTLTFELLGLFSSFL